MRFICSATFLFPPPIPVICAMGNPGMITSISGDLSSGLYWNYNTNSPNFAFTNPSMFSLKVGDIICVNGSNEIVSFESNPITAQLFIDSPSTPITNVFPGGQNLTAGLAQFFINENKINANATIVVTDLGAGGLQIVVTIRNGSAHTIAGLEVFANNVPVFFFEAPFTCRRIKRKRRFAFIGLCRPTTWPENCAPITNKSCGCG